MVCRLRNLSVLVFAVCAACNVSIPEGKFKCSSEQDCPSDWVCFESACYSELPSGASNGNGNGDGGQNAGNGNGDNTAGSNVGDGGGDDFDGGIDTTTCEVPSTFYRDSDMDGLGAAAATVSACSVAGGYVTNADDCNDTCTACTKPDAVEICDGFDNECDGKVDDGVLEFSTRVSFDDLEKSLWSEVVETAEGGVTFSVATIAGGTVLYGQRFNASGAKIGAVVTIPGALPAGLYNITADHLNGKIVLAWFESDGIKATVLKASDLTTLVAKKTISAGYNFPSPALDVALSLSASGGRALFSYAKGVAAYAQPFLLSDLGVDGPLQTLYTSSESYPWLMVTLAAAPCLSGYYVALLEEKARLLRIMPLGDDGVVAGTSYDVPLPADNVYFTALPALRTEGGDCNTAPTRLALAYAIENTLPLAMTSDVHLDYLTIARVNNLDKFTLAGSLNFQHMGGLLPAFYSLPSGAFYSYRAMDLIRYADRYLLALTTATSVDADRAALEVFEVEGTTRVAAHKAIDIQPAAPRTVQLALIKGRPWLATSSWSNGDPAGLMRIGCAPPP